MWAGRWGAFRSIQTEEFTCRVEETGGCVLKSENQPLFLRRIFPWREGHRLTAARPKGGCIGRRRGARPLPARTRSTSSPKGFWLQYGGNAWSVSWPEVLFHSSHFDEWFLSATLITFGTASFKPFNRIELLTS